MSCFYVNWPCDNAVARASASGRFESDVLGSLFVLCTDNLVEPDNWGKVACIDYAMRKLEVAECGGEA